MNFEVINNPRMSECPKSNENMSGTKRPMANNSQGRNVLS